MTLSKFRIILTWIKIKRYDTKCKSQVKNCEFNHSAIKIVYYFYFDHLHELSLLIGNCRVNPTIVTPLHFSSSMKKYKVTSLLNVGESDIDFDF